MTRILTCALVLAAGGVSLPAAVLRGTVVENTTGNPLARTLLTLSGTSGSVVSVRANERGGFTFDKLGAGGYVLRASRPGFLPVEYGQKRWNSAGTVIVIEADGAAAIDIRLSRYGAITGMVRDQNEVGIANQDVVAYKDTQPPEPTGARATSDDRGVFRIGGLEPGRYLVRSTGNVDGDLRYIPTFSPQTLRVEEARSVDVFADEDSRDADVRPLPGALYNLSGVAPVPNSSRPLTVTITLASDMGRRTAEGGAFNFKALAPGLYELFAVAKDDAGTVVYGGYSQLSLFRDTRLTLQMAEIRPTRFNIEGGQSGIAILARHKDLAGTGAAEALESTLAMLPPGNWEFMILPPAGSYVSAFRPAPRDTAVRPDGWNEMLVRQGSFASVTVTGGGGSVHGTLKSAGVPVFLEAWDPVTRKRLVELRTTRTDTQGRYRFDALPPGDYRILATFEYAMPGPAAMDLAGARDLRVDNRTDQQLDLDIYEIR